MLLGVNVDVVAELSPVLTTVPETALLELSTKEKVLLVIVELSINSLKVAEMLETSVVVPSDGEVEETVGAVVSDRLMKFQVCSVVNPLFPKSLTEVVKVAV